MSKFSVVGHRVYREQFEQLKLVHSRVTDDFPAFQMGSTIFQNSRKKTEWAESYW